jgi:TRAP-type C4-dicarboxylate transport system substrate-binding protein
VLQLSVVLQINLDVWNELSPAAKNILTEQAVVYEQQSRDFFFATRDREVAELEANGFNSVSMQPEAAENFRRFAHEVVWDRFEQRAPDSAATLKPFFYPQEAAGESDR